MAIAHTKLFITNRGQALRLPKDVALPASVNEVEIVAIGNTRVITPAGSSWDSWFDGPTVTEDFTTSRDQPAEQDREPF